MKFVLGFIVLLATASIVYAQSCDSYAMNSDDARCKWELNKPMPVCDTMCYPEKTCKKNDPLVPMCGPVSEAEKTLIVNKHNELRQKLSNDEEKRGMPGPQTPATNVYKLTWDDDLARVAQRWVEQLYWGHDCWMCRKSALNPSQGQNCAVRGRQNMKDPANWPEVIQDWYDEVQYWDGNLNVKNTKGNNNATGHFTQLMWHNTKKVGCAVYFADTPCTWVHHSWDEFKCQYYACNYGPGGNYGTKPYSTEEKDKCKNTDNFYDKLCV